MRNFSRVLVTALILITPLLCSAAERAEVPEAWKILPVCGQTFYNGSLGDEPHMWQLWENYADEPMFENVFLKLAGAANQRTHDFVRVPRGKDDPDRPKFVRKPTGIRYDKPLKIGDVLTRWGARGALVEKFLAKRPNGPFAIWLYDSRPSWQLDETYPNDKADFGKWLAAHPTFLGFESFDEYDNDILSFRNARERGHYDDPETARWIDRMFPHHASNEDLRPWGDENYRRIKEFYWGTTRLTGLWSNYYSFAFDILRHGMTFAWYEAESGNTGEPWRWGALYARGAARQFHVPFGWYMATLMDRTQTRTGERQTLGRDHSRGYTVWPNVRYRDLRPHSGQARSLLNRNEFYGMMIGATALYVERHEKILSGFDPVETNRVVLSPYGEDYRDIFRWQKTHDRGVLYTPVALLTSTDEVVSKTGAQIKYNHDVYAQHSFLTALVCPYADRAGYQFEYCQRPDKGDQGLMYNSEFGEFVDALSPDAGQKGEDFYRALRCYKAAILVGWLNPKCFDRESVVKYVKEGGVLYAENRHVEMGLIPATVEGAKGKIVLTDTFYDSRITGGKERWSYDKTRLLYSGEVENTKIKNLLRELQDRYMPVKVEGDIQWGVNLVEGGEVEKCSGGEVKKFREIAQKGEATSRRFDEKGNGKGNEGNTVAATVRSDEDVASPLPPHHSTTSPHWLVWLINNKGVTKWLWEPETVDLSKTADVKITDKRTGKVYTARVAPGKFTTIEVPFE